MKNSLSNLKNLLWAAAILLCLMALLLSLVFSMSQKNHEEREDGTITLGQIDRSRRNANALDIPGTQNTAPTLIPLPERSRGNLDDVFSMTFLCDKTILGLRTYASQYGDGVSEQIWTDDGSGFAAKNAAETPIVFVDGSLLTAANAAMITRPRTVVIYLGGDGLAETTDQEFVEGYVALINSIRSSSPATTVVACSIGSISSNYQGGDGLTSDMIFYANSWIRKVCASTGAYYADLASLLNDPYGKLSDDFMTPDGRSISAMGINLIVDYFRSHYI
jgi:hypothetical protein